MNEKVFNNLSADILPGVEKEPSPEGPTGIKKNHPIEQAECLTSNNLCMKWAECLTSEVVQYDV